MRDDDAQGYVVRLFALALLVTGLSAWAQTRVVDASGQPMIGALVTDGSGTPIGLVDKEGIMPGLMIDVLTLITAKCIISIGF